VVQEISAAGGKAIGFATDVTKRAEVEALIQGAVDGFGRVDVLLNNAGIMPIAPIEALKVDEWDRQIDVNIKGLLYGIAAALPHMQKQKSGHIINIASVFGIKMFAPGGTVYCATKAAVRALTEGLRMELHSQNIRCTMISPGAIATELSESSSDEATKKNLREFMKMAIPASAIARAIAYAMSSRSRWKSMRWSSAQRYRTFNAETPMRPFYFARWSRFLQVSRMVLVVSLMLAIFQLPAHAQGKERPLKHSTVYRTIQVDGLSIFIEKPVRKTRRRFFCCTDFRLPHGCSILFSPSFPIATPYRAGLPGFGHSDWPDPKKFAYTFDHLAETMNHFTEALALSRYALYMQDYGGPVGFRMALAIRIESRRSLSRTLWRTTKSGAIWKTRRAFWADRSANESALRANLLSLATTRTRHVGSDPNVECYDRTCGPMNLPFLASPARWISKRSLL